METVLIILALVLLFLGLLGCVLPAIPGPPLSYAGLLCFHFAMDSFTLNALIIYGVITLIVTALDFIIPVWGAKVFGATRQGVYGSIIGMIAGIFLTPVGMIAGLLIGAIVGDMVGGRKLEDAVGSGLGTFLGTMAAMAVKLIVSGIMTFLVFYKSISYLVEIFS